MPNCIVTLVMTALVLAWPSPARAQTPPASGFDFTAACTRGGQLCDGTYELRVRTGPRPTIRYAAAATHCSRIRVRVSLDGRLVFTSQFLNPSQDTGDIAIAATPGLHRVSLQAEGTPGGCNSGTFTSWSGRITTTSMVRQDDAAALAAAIKKTGKVDVYGILFDIDKTTIKPESVSTLDEVSKLLKADPALKLEVAGHTDNTGTAQHNVSLSNGRADAVVQALVKTYGIDPKRLEPKGYGDTKPVAPNDTEPHRAKNRRVELRRL
jgi:outer membrane protein OmpA-like peptidoglycan-associated protein